MKKQAVASIAIAAVALSAGVAGKLSLEDCYQVTALSGGEYVRISICVPQGEKLEKSKTLKGMKVVEAEPVVWTAAGTARAGESDGFECACAAHTNGLCETLRRRGKKEEWVPAPYGNTMAPGRWRGAGCYPKNCVELAGKTVWPPACPKE